MEQERRCLRIGIWAILLAAVLRLADSGLGNHVSAFFGKPETASFLFYLQTGRGLRPANTQTLPPETQPPDETLPPQPTGEVPQTDPQPIQPLPSFTQADAALVDITYHCDYEPDVAALLHAPLSWNLMGDEPTVLILHTHATECYTPSAGEDYTESSAYRTLNTDYNMVSVGDHLAQLLRGYGITVIHDRTLHDEPSYSAAYSSSRKAAQAYLEKYPTIRLVLDLHRDALSLDSEKQLDTHAAVDGKSSSQLMMVVGTDAGGLTHPKWQENMALAVKLHATLEKVNPGICRPISFRTQRFNQDLSGGALIIEVGGAGDTRTEALTAAEALAEAIVTLSQGTQE